MKKLIYIIPALMVLGIIGFLVWEASHVNEVPPESRCTISKICNGRAGDEKAYLDSCIVTRDGCQDRPAVVINKEKEKL